MVVQNSLKANCKELVSSVVSFFLEISDRIPDQMACIVTNMVMADTI